MKADQGEALLLASKLLAYPDDSYLLGLPALRERCQELSESSVSQFASACIDFIDKTLANDRSENARRYVEIFDLSALTSLYMTWHRYGNDRAQGKAMAALNGLYRAAGFEPKNPEMPDYLPRMLEFMAIGPDGHVRLFWTDSGRRLQCCWTIWKNWTPRTHNFSKKRLLPCVMVFPNFSSHARGMTQPKDPWPILLRNLLSPCSLYHASSHIGVTNE